MIIRNILTFQPSGVFVPHDLYLRGERFASTPSGECIDGCGCYAIPGLIDLHLHGCAGFDFCDGTESAFSSIAAYEAANGIAAFCPASMSFPEARLRTIFQAAAGFVPHENEAALIGIRMEGPFLAQTRKGAQNAAYLQMPDPAMFHRLQRAARGKIKLLDIAPELPGGLALITQLKSQVLCSLAHTDADYDTAREAFCRGARQVTHLFNAMPAFSHRAPGVVGAAFDTPDCGVELISDGVHVHSSAVRAAFRLFGDDRVLLISDSMMAAGLPDGEYALGEQAVTVTGRCARLQNGTIAGSVTNLLDCLRTAVCEMDIPLGSAVKAAAVNPAKAIGISSEYGSLAPGKLANFILLDDNLRLREVFLRGRPLHSPRR